MNNLNSSSKSIQSGLSNTPVKNENKFNNHKTSSSTLEDEIHCNKNTDQSNNRAHVSPVKTPKSSLQSLYETDEEHCKQKKEPVESKLESGLYHNNNNHNNTNHNEEEKDTAAKRTSIEGGFEPWNNDADDPDNPKRYIYSKDRMFTLKERDNESNNSTEDTLSTTAYRTNSLSDMKIGIHRKISSERTKPKRLRKHSSLKEFKIQYSSNLHSLKQRDKLKTKCHQKEGKRVGLPAELFANDVSFAMKNNSRNEISSCHTSPTRLKPPSVNRADNINGSFYSLSNSSPVSSYSNPYFQSDDVIYSSPLLPSSASSLDLSKAATKADHLVANNNSAASNNINQRPNTSDFPV